MSDDLPDWVLLARLAQLAHAGKAGVRSHRADLNYHTLDLFLELHIPTACYQDLVAEQGDMVEEAEATSVRWAERAAELGRGAREPARLPDGWSAPCPVCEATPGKACRPTHGGEREPGTWAHPTRVAWARALSAGGAGALECDWRLDPEAVALAHRVVATHWQSPLRPRMGPTDMERLARAVIAADLRERGGRAPDLPDGLSPDHASGEWLDRVAAVVGIQRAGESDSDLRFRLLEVVRDLRSVEHSGRERLLAPCAGCGFTHSGGDCPR